MKRVKHLEDKILSYENVIAAFEDTTRKMRYKPSMLWLKSHMEEVIIDTMDRLRDRTWKPVGFHEFMIREPKLRKISAPAVTDRFVHHILCRVIEPILDKKFIDTSYACRKGKGMLSACKRVQHNLRSLGDGDVYVYRIDIRKFFHSIDHEVLKRIMRRHFADDFVLWLLDVIIDSYPEGLPIGSLTSQLMANVVLNELDHHMECANYVRYMDDVIIVSKDREELTFLDRKARAYIENVLHLQVNRKKTHITRYLHGIDFAGYRITPWRLYPRKRNVKAAGRRLRKLRRTNVPKYEASKQSFFGYMKHCSWTSDATRAIMVA
jgi:retron-type reverse transcriptase